MGQNLQPWSFPFASPMAMASFWQSFGGVAKATEPVMRTVAQTQCEAVGFAANRTRAWLDLPSTVSRCRTPQELAAAQMQFWQTASHEYMAFGQRVAQGWQAQFAAGQTALNAAAEMARDRIELPEAPPSRRSTGDRDFPVVFGDENRADRNRHAA